MPVITANEVPEKMNVHAQATCNVIFGGQQSRWSRRQQGSSEERQLWGPSKREHTPPWQGI
jgi:hypothetical protein